MAYGNWGAWVYKNKEHMPRWEDNIPYSEAESDPGYHLAFQVQALGGLSVQHAVLGDDEPSDGCTLTLDDIRELGL